MSNNNCSDHRWEPWQLSAYVLGELDPDVSSRIAAALENDEMLLSEVDALRKTVSQVESALVAEWQPADAQVDSTAIDEALVAQSRRDGRLESIFRLAEESEVGSDEASTRSPASALAAGVVRWRMTFAGLLAMSACLFVAVWMSLPGPVPGPGSVNGPGPVPGLVPGPGLSAGADLNGGKVLGGDKVTDGNQFDGKERTEVPDARLLADRGEPANAGGGERNPVHLSDVDAEIDGQGQASELERELAQASEMDAVELEKLDHEVVLADNIESAPAQPLVEESIRGAAALGAIDQLAANGDLFGDVSIEFVEEIDLVIVRGSKRDVQRTVEVIDAKKRELQDLDTDQIVLGQPAPQFESESPAFGGFDRLADAARLENVGGLAEGMGGFGGDYTGGFYGGGMYGSGGYGGGTHNANSNDQMELLGENEIVEESIGTTDPSVTDLSVTMAVALDENHEADEGRELELRLSTQAANLERTALFPLKVRERELIQSVGEGHPSVATLRRRIESLEKRIERIRKQEVTNPHRASGGRFGDLYENPFRQVLQAPLSTFSIDVDSASYAKTRQLLLKAKRLPPADAVRIEEFVNYFEYEYSGPTNGQDPFGADFALSACPWQPRNKLVRIALQAEKLELENRPAANMVFLLDVSGSMDKPHKLPLVKDALRMVVEQLGENDRVAIVVYAGAAGCVLEPTSGTDQDTILAALDALKAGGSTNGSDGIQLAYQMARDQFVPGGINRVILCTDGDFNVGLTSTDDLISLVEENAKSEVFLTVLGFGMNNTNDEMLEEITNRGNGIYGFIDNRREAHRQMVRQLVGNLVNVAKDVKIQVEFNPKKVKAYRLLGYENRLLLDEDFDDDSKDAGEIGAGHQVTAFYEIAPVNLDASKGKETKPLRYQSNRYRASDTAGLNAATHPSKEKASEAGKYDDEWLCVGVRFKPMESDESHLLKFPLELEARSFDQVDMDFRWAASMVEFGMLLRDSRYVGNANWEDLIDQATAAAGLSPDADRQECLEMIQAAAAIFEANRRSLRQQR